MNLIDEIKQLQALHDNGTLNDEEFARAKSVLLANPPQETAQASNSAIEQELTQIRFQSELERLDREWAQEREKYMVTSKSGAKSVPDAGGTVLGAIAAGALLLVFAIMSGSVFGGHSEPSSPWTATSSASGPSMNQPGDAFGGFFVLIIVVAVCMILFTVVNVMSKAGDYESAEQEYQAQREALLAKQKRGTDRS